ncbi:MAG: hypothetical protein ACE5D7_11240 [Fidelibacterota bacterium]
MADVVYSPTQFRFAMAEESTFGTANTTQGDFKELFITEPVEIDWGGVVRDQHKRADGKRVLSHTDVYLSKAGGDYVANVTGIVTDLTLDLLLYGIMQDLVSEASATPFAKIFEWDGSSGVVDFSVNEGKFFTLLGYDPATSYHWQIKSAIIKELTLNADPGTNGGRLSFNASFYSGFAPTITGITATPGSWVAPGVDFYPFQTLNTKTIAGGNVVLGSFSLTLNNNAIKTGYDSSGDATNYALGVGGDGLTVTGEAKVKYDAASDQEIDKFLLTPDGGSSESNIIVQWGDGSADGTAKFDINAIYTGNSKDFGNDAGVFVNLPFQGIDDGTNEAIEVTVANSTDRTW